MVCIHYVANISALGWCNSALSFIRAIACYIGCRFCLFKVLHRHNCANTSQAESEAKSPESAAGCGRRGHRVAPLFFLSGAAPGSVAHWHHTLQCWLRSHVALRKTLSCSDYTGLSSYRSNILEALVSYFTVTKQSMHFTVRDDSYEENKSQSID